MKLKTWKIKIKQFNLSWIMAFIDIAHNHYSCSKSKSSGIWTCSLSGLILSLFSFGVYIFQSPLIFLLGLFTLFLTFYYFFIFSKYGKTTCRKQGMYIFTILSKSIQNYESYYYRTLTVAPHGDDISWWNIKNSKT